LITGSGWHNFNSDWLTGGQMSLALTDETCLEVVNFVLVVLVPPLAGGFVGALVMQVLLTDSKVLRKTSGSTCFS
jgi:hypothetical protein